MTNQKVSECLKHKDSEVANLVDAIQELAEKKGMRLSRWQTNSKRYYAQDIVYRLHYGEKAQQASIQHETIMAVILYREEGKTARCEAYKALYAMYKTLLRYKTRWDVQTYQAGNDYLNGMLALDYGLAPIKKNDLMKKAVVDNAY